MQDMQVSELVARMRSRAGEMRITAEEYAIEAKFHSDKALDLRLGAMEIEQRIIFIAEFVDGEPDETSAAKPGSEVAASDAAAASAGEVFPSASPAPILDQDGETAAPVDPVTTSDASVSGTDTALDGVLITTPSAEGPTDEAGLASSSEPMPVYSRAGHIGSWVRGDQAAVDADNEEQDLVEVVAQEKAEVAPPAGEAPVSPAPTTKDRVKALHKAHPEYTARQAREALGITKGSLSGASFLLGIKWAHEAPQPKATPPVVARQPEPPRAAVQYAPGSTGERVRIVHEQHPTWTARLIANHLGAAEKTVANALAEIRRQAKAELPPEFAGRAELVGHYTDVAKRLGKV